LTLKTLKLEQAVDVCACNLSTQRLRWEDPEFEASIGYISKLSTTTTTAKKIPKC
jgi:hypothetical protein